MRNIYCGLTVCELMKIPIDIILGDRVERGGRLIEDYYRRVAVNGACYRDLLTLAARELYTVGVELLIDIGINAAGRVFIRSVSPHFTMASSSFSVSGSVSIAIFSATVKLNREKS